MCDISIEKGTAGFIATSIFFKINTHAITYLFNFVFKIAFEDLEKIPSHEHLRGKHKAYLEDLQERLTKRTKLRNYFNSTVKSEKSLFIDF